MIGRAGRRPWVLAVIVAAGLSPIVASGFLSDHSTGSVGAAETGQQPTLTGGYLAAQFAESTRAEGAAANFYAAALERSPKDPVLLTHVAAALVLDGRTSEAIPYAKRLVAVDPASELGQVILAVAAIHDGRYAAATAALKAVPSGGPHDISTVPLLAAWAAFGRGDEAAALESLRRLEANPATAYLVPLHSAWVKDASDDPRGAADDLAALLTTQKDPWLRLAKLGTALFLRAGRPDDANALRQSYLSRHSDASVLGLEVTEPRHAGKPELQTARDGAAEALFDASGVFARQNDRETALLLGQLGLYLKPDFPELRLIVADLMEGFDRLTEANQTYAAISPSSPLAWIGRLSMAQNLDRLDQFSNAETILRAMAKERPDDPEPLIQLGDMLRQHERFAEAVVVYDEAAARIPSLDKGHWRLLYARGIALERSKQWDRAEADFLKALELQPDQPFVLNYLGYSWVEQGQNLDRAEQLIRRAVELRPNDGYIVDSLGWVLYRLGRPEEAVPHMERAVELRPEDPVINDHLGDVYWAVGRQREARYQWRAALSRDPEPDLRATIEQKLERGLHREANAAP